MASKKGPAVPSILLSTENLRAHEQADFWRETATRAFVRHDFRSGSGPSFRGVIEAGWLARLGIATFDCEPCTVTRTLKDAARDDRDAIQLCLQVSGKTEIVQDNREGIAFAGDLVLVDTRRAFTVDYRADTKASVVTIPRRLLEARIGRDAQFAAHKFDRQNPMARMVAAMVAGLPACMDRLEKSTALHLAEQMVDLVALAYTVGTDTKPVGLSSPRLAALLRLKLGIDHLLTDPELKPAMAADAAGISIRYANALLSEEGTSTEDYIVARRLERCRRTLEDPAQAHRSIADIAFGWGFSSIPHFCRRFKTKYGLSPRDYRLQSFSARQQSV